MKSAQKYKLTPARIALLYAAFAGLWIFASGKVLSYLVANPETMQRIEVAKGLVFVTITSALLYLLLRVWQEPKLTVHQLQNQHIAQPKQRGLMALLICLSLIVPLSGVAINQLYGPKLEHQAFDDLSAVAKLKSSQIELWVKERLGDAAFVIKNKTIQQDANKTLSLEDKLAGQLLLEKFLAMTQAYGYENIVLFNLRQQPVLSVKAFNDLENLLLQQSINQAISTKNITHTDIYFTPRGELRFDFVIPISDVHVPGKIIGVIALISAPKQHLAPIVSAWPTSETTARTLLIDSRNGALISFEKENPKALFPQTHGHPYLTVYNQPLVRSAVSGQFKGLDHDGVPVLVASYPVAGLTWKVMTQIEQDEVFKPLHGLTIWVGTVAFFSIAALSAAILMIWRQRNHAYNLAVLAEKNKSDALISNFFDLPFIGMAMVKPGADRWFNVNDEFCHMLGYSKQELLAKSWVEVSHPDDAYISSPMMRDLMQGKSDRLRAEKRYIHKNGQVVYVQLELKAIKDADGKIEYVLGAVSDITHFKLLLQQLEERERRLDTLVHTIPDLIWLKDPDGVYLSCNRQFERLYGSREEEIIGKTDYDFVSKELADFFRENDLAATSAGHPTVNEEWLTFADNGETGLFETIKTPINDESGHLIGVLGIARNITERQQANEKIHRLTRLYVWQGRCNKAIVDCQSAAELFERICHEAVEYGGLSLAWIGMVRPDNMLEILTSDGDGQKYLESIQISVDPASPYGNGPTGTAIRNNQPYWCNDFATSDATKPWHDRAAEFGWKSSASIPLCRDNLPIGALTLYADYPDAFDPETQSLLLSIGQDINFAMRHLEIETAKRRAEAQLLKLSQAVEQSPNTIVITDLDANIEYVNDAFCRITGYSMAEVIGRNPKVLQSGKTPPSTYDDMWDKLSHGKVWQGELVNRRKDNSEYIEYAIISPIKQSDGTVSHYLAIKQDITEIKHNEAQLKLSAKVFEQGNEGIIITDHEKNIIMVNRAFTEISGYTAEEVMGKNPRILSSGHQDTAFYRDMWDTIETTGRWQGELWNRRKDGGMYPELLSITRVIDENTGKPQYIGIFTDITQSKMAEDRIRWLAHYDALTGLANRELLHLRASQALSSCTRHSMPLALMFLDLDRFKNINDSLGHQVGDELIKDVGSKLKACLRDEDTIARLGGDEFVVVLANADAKAATQVAEKILNVTSQPIKIADYELNITASIGIAIFPDDSTDLTELMQKADTAMYRTKQNGRNGFSFFTPDMQATADRTLSLDNALRRAIEKNELMVFFQPQIDLANGKLVGAEALLRWKHAQWGMISPAEFIPIAEESGQILQIGEWVLRNALLALKTWLSDGFDPFRMSVNLSAIQFRFKDLPDQVQKILEESGVPPEYLELEITESVSMQDPQAAIEMTKRLSELGIRLSIDDFGTGYSSLSYLKQMNVYKLKIDQSFVRDISIDQDDKAIVNAVIGLAKSMGMITIAEGVETAEQYEYLKQNGCNEVQGYYFGRPMDSVSFENFLKESHPKA